MFGSRKVDFSVLAYHRVSQHLKPQMCWINRFSRVFNEFSVSKVFIGIDNRNSIALAYHKLKERITSHSHSYK